MLRGTSLLLATKVPMGSGRAVKPAIRTWPMQFTYRNPVEGISPQRRHLGDSPSTTQQITQSKETEYHGACHCGSIKVHFRTQKTPAELRSRACQCTFCRLHGASFTSDAAGSLSIVKNSSSIANPYRMGTGTADFLTCTNCGVVPAATWKRDDGKLLSVVRVQCLDIRDELEKHEIRWDLDHELTKPEERFARRSRTWTPTTVQD